MLSEIIFNPKTKSDYDKQYKLIKSAINDEGFEKAALSFSISDSSKNGGKLGWINENGLNEKIRKSLSKVKINNNTDPIKIPNGFLMLKINDIKDMIKESNGITKEELIQKLKWGGGITWTPYRRALLEDSNIFDVQDITPTYHWREDD